MTREQLDEVTRVVVLRCMAAGGGVLEEFEHRYPEHETLLEAVRQRQRESLAALIPIPEVKHSTK